MSEHPAATVMLQQLAMVFGLVLINAFFVASEFALVSVRRARVDQMAAEGHSGATAVQHAVHHLTRYIAATQVGVTIASLLLGGLGERVLEPLLQPLFFWMPARWLGITQIGLATAFAYVVMTTMHVVLGELMPKTIALRSTELVALWTVRPMTMFVWLVTPLVWFLNGLGGFLLRALGVQAMDAHAQVHSPEELDRLFIESHEGGQINTTEYEILHRVVKFSDVTAREIMVPRVEMWLSVEMTHDELIQFLHGQPHTRVPVFSGSLDDIIGVLHLKDVVRYEAELSTGVVPAGPDKKINLMSLVREVVRLPETLSIDRLLVAFKQQRQQIAIIIDEYGGTSGLVTMGDLLEQVFGDLHDEFDRPEPDVVESADGPVSLAGRVLIDEVNERFGTNFDVDEADTMAGLVLAHLGRPAVVGDEVEINSTRLRVDAVDRLRIIRLGMHLPSEKLGKR